MKFRVTGALTLSFLYLALSTPLIFGRGLDLHGELYSYVWVLASLPALLVVYGTDEGMKMSALVLLLSLFQWALIGALLGWPIDRRQKKAGNRLPGTGVA